MITTFRLRLALGAVGVLGVVYGAKLILTNRRVDNPVGLARWLIAGVVLHDGILVPVTMAVGWVLTVVFRPRARRYVQGALVAIGLVAIITVPLIYRHDKSQPGQALLRQNYVGHFAAIAGLIAAAAVTAYVVRVLRDRVGNAAGAAQLSSATNVRPPDDQISPTE